MKRQAVGIIFIILLIIMSVILYQSVLKSKKLMTQNLKTFDYDLPSTFSLPSEDSNIFNYGYFSTFKTVEVFRSKVRSPITLLSYDSNYNLILYKLPLSSKESLIKILFLNEKNADLTEGYTYGIIGNEIPYNFNYVFQDSSYNSKIFLTFKGDSLQKKVITPNFIIYHLALKNFSISYSPSGPIDILINKPKNIYSNPPLSLNIAFLKKQDNFFLIILSAKNGTSVNTNLIVNLISK